MKLRNKKTGEIIDDGYVRETHDFQFDGQKHVLAVFNGNGHRPPERVSGAYNSLAELNAEWEDYEEPKGIQCIYYVNHFDAAKIDGVIVGFGTKEEAEKAAEKLKAWKRLEDTYFVSFDLDFVKNTISFTYRIDGTLHSAVNEERIVFEDMKTIFGGKE